LIIGGRNSQIKVLESHHGLGEKAYFNNAVTEVVVQENARINHMRVQDESPGAYHITSLQAYQERDSYYSLVNVDLGGALVRNNLSIKLDAENCEAHIIGFYLGGGKQHMDNHTAIDHAKPNCFSNELYKGILGGKARGVFSGKIFVHPDAQKTNAYQNNKALILSDDAVINTKPQLEIFADDVKCSHGATVGQLDKEALFYLRSRGIAEEKANSILQYAFASDVFNYIPIEAVKERLNEIILNRLDQL
jgi:Fe-S cluster assembly protein SufD